MSLRLAGVVFLFLGFGCMTAEERRQAETQSKVEEASHGLSYIKNTLNLYRLRYGSYPTAEEGLKKLLTLNPASAAKESWIRSEALQDPWGHPYLYSIAPNPTPPPRHKVEVSSSGPDGLPGTADDIKEKVL